MQNKKRLPLLLVLVIGMAQVAIASPNADVAIIEQFRQLRKNTNWEEADTRPVQFRTYHPQGMAAVADRFFLSSVEVINRAAEEGVGHLFELDRDGALLRHITLGEDALYHPGGIDYDGTHIWAPVAAYRPDSATIMYTVDPDTMESREVFRFDDHLGAVTHLPNKNMLLAVSWGARRFYRWNTTREDGCWTVLEPSAPDMQYNVSHYVDYQDMQWIPGTSYVICSGVQTYRIPGTRLPAFRLGGLELIDATDLRIHHQVPVPLRHPAAPAWTQNPFLVESDAAGLRFFFIPEDDESHIHIFEPTLQP